MSSATEISLSISFPNPVRQQSRQSHSVSSRRCWRRNTARQRLQRVSMRQQTRQEGALKNLATEEGYETFVVPDDVGGRFSVLTAVGLLPIAVSGADIDKLMEGAAAGRKHALESMHLRRTMHCSMRHSATSCLRKGKTSRDSVQTTSRACTTYLSGGSSCTVRAKEKTRRVSSRHLLI